MKKFLLEVMMLVGLGSVAFASDTVYYKSLVDANLASSGTYVLDCSQLGIDYLSFQLIFSTPTLYPSAFIDGVRSTGTIYITATGNAGVRGSTLTIQGQTFIEGTDYTYTSGYSTMTAYSLWKVLNSTYGVRASGYLTVLSTFSLVGSSFTMFNNTFVAGTDWTIGYSSWSSANAIKATASSIYTDLSNYFNTTLLCQLWTSSMNFTYNALGDAGNSTISCWVSSIAASGMSGGVNPPLSGIVFDSSSVRALGIIYATASVTGAGGNYTFTSSVSTSMVVTGMGGGIASQVLYAPYYTIIATQTYPTGQALLFTVGAGSAPWALTANATYWALNSNGSTLQLASTRDNAVAGTNILLVNSKKDRGSFTLTPINMQGIVYATSTAGAYWQASNDGVNYYNLNVASITIYSTTTWTNNILDIGKFDYAYIRCVVGTPLNWLGSIYLKIVGFGKKIAP